LENWNIAKSGVKVCLKTNGVPVFNVSGKLTGYRGVDKDITEVKLAEQKSLEDTAKFRTIFKESSTGLYRTSFDGRVMIANDAFAHMFGYDSPEDLMKLNASQLYADPEQRYDFIKSVERMKSLNTHLRFRKKNGDEFFAECFAVGAFKKDGSLDHITGTVYERIKYEEIIPVCSYCHNIRTIESEWVPFTNGLFRYGVENLSHGICPDCSMELHKKLETG
jgi:PAS domain S-box-containing protein